ncbi:MAG: FHIPEP family type III secretion protein, partial [Hyphomicrobiales bacterium]
GLLITFITILGGMIVGVGQNGMSMADAGATYTLLTIGDGLVSQIPALIVSTAAGLLVSKAGVDGAAEKALFDQLSGYPKALGMSSFVMVLMSVLPGIPMIPFLALAGAAGGLAWKAGRGQKMQRDEAQAIQVAEKVEAQPKEPPISEALHMDELRLELGYGLLPLIRDPAGDSDKLTDQIKALRRQLATQMGFVMPSVRILDNMQLAPNDYVIKVKEVDAGSGTLFPGQIMVMDPQGRQIDLPGTHTAEPTFGLPATWIDTNLRDEATFRGYTVVDPVTVISTHLTEILKAHMSELLSYAEVNGLLDKLPDKEKKLLEDLIPGQISTTGLQRILQALLAERVSIRDLPTILEGVAEATASTQNIPAITEHVRTRLARQICAGHLSPKGYLPLVTLSPRWEREFAEALVGEGDNRQLAMQPSRLQEFIKSIRTAFEQAAAQGEAPVLMTSPAIRPFVRSIVERFRAQTPVLSQNEIHPQAKLKTVASV